MRRSQGLRTLSLFSGIGGIDLGLERAGHTVVAQSEVDPYCCRVLAKHWPDVPNLGDVTTIDWNDLHGLGIELVAGGYPCQPFSLATTGRKGTKDVRYLWPYMLDAVRVLRPRVALLENVPGHLSKGFGRVLGDLAEIGYHAEWDCLAASSVGAPHRRDRVFVVAYPEGVTVGPRLRSDQPPEIWWRRPGDVSGEDITWPAEPDVCRVAHGVPHRVDRLRGLGNAVVPQVAEYIGRMLAVA